MEKDLTTEEAILKAAKQEFFEKGFDGARMQDIADRAKINKALLHYYFRSKDKLFEAIFQEVSQKLFPMIGEIFSSDLSIENKVRAFVKGYTKFLMEYPFLPIFVIREVYTRPEMFYKHFISNLSERKDVVEKKLLQEMELGNIEKMDPKYFIINIIALAVFPFAARPMLQMMFGLNEEKEYFAFLENRIEPLTDYILKAIKK